MILHLSPLERVTKLFQSHSAVGLQTVTGKIWFGSSVWQGQQVFRLSVSSWRTTDDDIEGVIYLLSSLRDHNVGI